MGANHSTVEQSLTQQFHKLDKDRSAAKKRGYLVCVMCLDRACDQLAREPPPPPPPLKHAQRRCSPQKTTQNKEPQAGHAAAAAVGRARDAHGRAVDR